MSEGMELASPGQHAPAPPHPRRPGSHTLIKPGLEVKTSRGKSVGGSRRDESKGTRAWQTCQWPVQSLERVLCVCPPGWHLPLPGPLLSLPPHQVTLPTRPLPPLTLLLPRAPQYRRV